MDRRSEDFPGASKLHLTRDEIPYSLLLRSSALLGRAGRARRGAKDDRYAAASGQFGDESGIGA